MNLVMLIGNLGKDPEVRYTPTGTAVCNFSVATTERVKNENKTEWHNIVAFTKTAEACGEYLTKGSKVGIQGRLQTRSWDDKNGVKQYRTEVVVDKIEFLDKKEKSNTGPVDVDDAPF